MKDPVEGRTNGQRAHERVAGEEEKPLRCWTVSQKKKSKNGYSEELNSTCTRTSTRTHIHCDSGTFRMRSSLSTAKICVETHTHALADFTCFLTTVLQTNPPTLKIKMLLSSDPCSRKSPDRRGRD
ncbi:hypothetical protein XENORESO_016270 [Xenotaenia resolanae]|uniref:Uncharacterized protein n=1 Tax=Xenotaenia resolanae TaxID=208358 RepID=A0ABV0WML9_9TELE